MKSSVLENIIAMFAAAVVVFGGLFILALVFSIPVWLLWNWIVVGTLHIFPTELTLVQALGLNLLSACLFKSSSTK